MVDLKCIGAVDPELYGSMVEELRRQQHNLELIASENIVSPAVMAAAGSFYTNKYAEGYPRKRYYGGCQFVDRAEELAIERAKELFGVKFANVQAHSGSNANFAVYYAVLQPGDTVLGMSLSEGGHLTHGSPVNLSGKLFRFVSYGLDPETGRIDYDDVRKKALKYKPKLIVAGASAYARTIEFDKFRAIADEVGAYFMVDIAHIAGLVAAGLHPSPVPYADFVTSTTHKTLRGPRGGLIMTNNEELAKLIDKTIFPGSQGGPLMHIIAAKAVAFKEALTPEFREYQKQVVANAKALAETLLAEGVNLVSGGTDNHLMLLNLVGTGVTGKQLEKWLDEAHITVNKNAVPNDPEKPFVTSGVRIGTPAVTTRGMKEEDMKVIGKCIADIIKNGEEAIPRALRRASSLRERRHLLSAERERRLPHAKTDSMEPSRGAALFMRFCGRVRSARVRHGRQRLLMRHSVSMKVRTSVPAKPMSPKGVSAYVCVRGAPRVPPSAPSPSCRGDAVSGDGAPVFIMFMRRGRRRLMPSWGASPAVSAEPVAAVFAFSIPMRTGSIALMSAFPFSVPPLFMPPSRFINAIIVPKSVMVHLTIQYMTAYHVRDSSMSRDELMRELEHEAAALRAQGMLDTAKLEEFLRSAAPYMTADQIARMRELIDALR